MIYIKIRCFYPAEGKIMAQNLPIFKRAKQDRKPEHLCADP